MGQDYSKFTAEDWKNYKPEVPEEEEKTEKQSAILEIRAGQGGDEAGLFARDLYRMYSRYGQTKGWKEKVLESNNSAVGGYKEIIFELSGSGVYDELQNEGGVHRVQRIPSTEKQGRVHTSTATVAVLLKPKKTEFNISPADLEISTYKSSGPGGQYVNKQNRQSELFINLPDLLSPLSQKETSSKIKKLQWNFYQPRLLRAKEEADLSALSTERRDQIGWAKRSEKMRTYNFPQDRITDHRINKSWHDIESIMDGKLDGIVKAFKNLDKKEE